MLYFHRKAVYKNFFSNAMIFTELLSVSRGKYQQASVATDCDE